MKSKAAFIVGTGIGYVLGTRAGRRQFEVIKGHAKDLWASDSVQSTVTTFQDKATEVAKDQGAVLKGKVTEAVKNVTSKDHSQSTPPAPAAPAGDPWTTNDGVGHA
ncbi:hypothetical protein [Sanguibacter antarcticus]|uniref:YtxH-like protein n=1 Tax=Sanguibacter antarcticus TaxID=372484 RepID=A0A2A9E2J7_9MICO|nr:hypothetical protein [Sanguibacter antarcticus]PFG33178.1 hypothetical protein ATL42_1038 [Sanguibacter antarcticus]